MLCGEQKIELFLRYDGTIREKMYQMKEISWVTGDIFFTPAIHAACRKNVFLCKGEKDFVDCRSKKNPGDERMEDAGRGQFLLFTTNSCFV